MTQWDGKSDFFEEDEPLEDVLAAFEQGEKVVTARPEEQERILQEIVRRFARLRRGTGSNVQYCGPSRNEREMRDLHNAWDTAPKRKKVIYPDRPAAEAAAAEMTERLGFEPQYAYTCQRSKHGHQHLTRTPIKTVR